MKKTDEAVKKALDKLEQDTIISQGYKNISGAFAIADIFDYDNEFFDIELKFGIQDGEENYVYTEQLKMDRKTLKIVN